ADKGHTIVLVTHATNNINSCDYVCFLCQGGHLAYFGPPEEAKAYFGKTDFAEIYSSLEPTEENRNIPEEAEARFKVSKQYQEYVIDPLKSDTGETAGIDGRPKVQELKRPKHGNPFKQFSLLFRRQLKLFKNNNNGKAYVTKKTNGNVNKALQDFILPGGGSLAQIALFIVAFIAVMFGTVNGIREIVKENAIYRRERTVNLGIMPYLLSKVIVLGVISL